MIKLPTQDEIDDIMKYPHYSGGDDVFAMDESTGTFVRKSKPLDYWQQERVDVMTRFTEELKKVTGDGSKKRQAKEKPPWYQDSSHEAAIFSHLMKWKKGHKLDPDSGAHPLVHAAWRCLAIACSESGNTP